MITKLTKPALAAGLAIAALAAPASAQVNGIGSSRIGVTVANSQALQNGYQQIATTYQAQIQQINQLAQQREQVVRGLDTNSDGQLSEEEANAAPEATVQQVQQLDQQIAEAQAPVQRARLYVVNQVGQNYGPAVQQVMSDKSISIMVAPEAIDFASDGVDVTADVVTALNTRFPTASITPPEGWQANQATVELYQEVQQLFTLLAIQQQQAQQQGGQAAPATGGEVQRN